MGSNGGGGGGGGGGGDGGGDTVAKTGGLRRQGSLYDLTLDEVQHQLGDFGKPLGSMNLDELLKSVWTAESNMNVDYSHHGQPVSASSLARQSSLNLAHDLRKRTVEEVFQGIQQVQKQNSGNSSSNSDGHDQERQPALGEMTLEDFLVKAGIVAGKINAGSNQRSVNQQQDQWMQQYQAAAPIQQQQQLVYMPGHHAVQQPLSIGVNTMMDMGYPETQMAISPSHLVLSDTQTPGRKRVASGDVVEKTVERRQKRMIKNRESAARSRARKQAYTHELENKISRLEEENERLKRQKEVGMVLPSAPPPNPKYQLRRTSSASF